MKYDVMKLGRLRAQLEGVRTAYSGVNTAAINSHLDARDAYRRAVDTCGLAGLDRAQPTADLASKLEADLAKHMQAGFRERDEEAIQAIRGALPDAAYCASSLEKTRLLREREVILKAELNELKNLVDACEAWAQAQGA